jgi:diguanylate cyclase (GGDEF)-like protein
MAGLATYLALCAIDTWKAGRVVAQSVADRSFEVLARALAVAFAATAGFYLVRSVALVALGGESRPFQQWFGSGVTSLVQIFMMTAVAFTMASLVTAQQVRELHLLASRDPLTGVLNRTVFLTLARARLAQSAVQDSVVVLADLDRFKSVNDQFGHATGDRVLRAYAQACSGVLRAGDLVCRFGGEEFVLLLPDATPADAERLTRLITTRFQTLASLPDFTATASYGLASTEDGADLELLIDRADRALYRAKETGRDRAVHFAALAG